MADEFTKAALYWIKTFNKKAKEKIWIEKLIELLNEYGNEICNHWGNYQTDMDFTDRDTYWYLSKKFWFIKWLVENDKIDTEKVYKNLTNYEIEIRIRAVKELLENNEEDTISYLKLLMLLSIQDEPIRFLCEIIK